MQFYTKFDITTGTTTIQSVKHKFAAKDSV